MSLPLPTSLSPSKVASFKDCGLAFRFNAIDRLPEAPSPHAAKGTLVHRALELLMWEQPPGRRSLPAALACLDRARSDVRDDPEYQQLDLGDETEDQWLADADQLVRNYFELEDPNEVRLVGTELRLSVEVGSLTMRGIIDRLELDDDGGLVVTDYKTGRAPGTSYEQPRLDGVHFYAFLCERVLGRRPARIQLLHLREPIAISTVPSEQSIRGLEQRASAIWAAVEQACERDDFRPNPGRVCQHCAYQAYCPAFGGDPALASEAAAAVRAPSTAAGREAATARRPVSAPTAGAETIRASTEPATAGAETVGARTESGAPAAATAAPCPTQTLAAPSGVR